MTKILKKYINYIILFTIVALIFIFIIINNNKINEYSSNIFYMDTYINVRIFSNNEKLAKKGLEEVKKIYEEYHQLTDKYNDYYGMINVSYINNNLYNKDTITINNKLYEILKYGIEFYEKSNGLLNINIGSVTDIWKKYRENKSGIPTIEELNKKSIDITNIKLLNETSILNNRPNIDLGAISKGYTTEVAGEYLESIGIDKYIINAGGNVKVGNHYDKSLYKIGIQNPTEAGGIMEIVTGNNISVVTSGDYERNYEYDGVIYHHIINPKTLFPSNYMKSVTIVCEDSALADALSTVLFLMEIDEGIEYLKQYENVEAIWYTNDNKIIKTDGFNKYEQK